jgi:hypothetical protein
MLLAAGFLFIQPSQWNGHIDVLVQWLLILAFVSAALVLTVGLIANFLGDVVQWWPKFKAAPFWYCVEGLVIVAFSVVAVLLALLIGPD